MIGLRTPRRLRRLWWKAKRLTIGDLITYAIFAAIGTVLGVSLWADQGGSTAAACAPGVVTAVVDGDTLDVGDCRVRLLAVDAPETQWRSRATPWCAAYDVGQLAKQVVEQHTLGRHVTFGATEDDSSGRDMAAEVYLPDGTELGGWLVQAGLAVPWPAPSPAEACPAGTGPGMEPSR